MARFRRKRRTYGRLRAYAKRGRGGSTKGVTGNIIDGMIAGVISSLIPDDMLFGFADPLAMGIWGWYRKNPTLITLAAMTGGTKLLTGVNVLKIGSSTSTGSGFIN
jgi:hypothetical protein